MTPEQRYRLELAKERTPSTSAFLWIIPVFLAACWLCKSTDAGQEVAQQVESIHVDVPQVHYVKQQYSNTQDGNARFVKYPCGDPDCGCERFCFLGWSL